MTAPSEFIARLTSVFDGRLRIRWSDKEQNFHIEQKVGRAVVAPVFIDESRDDLIRARDGYHPVMTIQPGDRMPCPSCRFTLKVPVMDTHDMKCPYCALKGRSTRVVAGYWPLNDLLIDHLRKIDPLRDGSTELRDEADRHNKNLLKAQEDAAHAPGLEKFSEDYNRIVGIESNTSKHLPRYGWETKETSA